MYGTCIVGAILRLRRFAPLPRGVSIVSLGLVKTPAALVMVLAGVVLLTSIGWFINRAAGVPAPVWAAKE
ncbi:MAG TPA: hypothetical protein VHM16_05660 [Rubrobacteraceae bacterium]|nr:hypothetical protein [Rubrobacteraceae bacterium]